MRLSAGLNLSRPVLKVLIHMSSVKATFAIYSEQPFNLQRHEIKKPCAVLSAISTFVYSLEWNPVNEKIIGRKGIDKGFIKKSVFANMNTKWIEVFET